MQLRLSVAIIVKIAATMEQCLTYALYYVLKEPFMSLKIHQQVSGRTSFYF